MGSSSHLNQFEPDSFYRLLNLLRLALILLFELIIPMRSYKRGKCVITKDIQAQIIIEVNKLLFSEVSLGCKRNQIKHLLFDFLFGFLLEFEF